MSKFIGMFAKEELLDIIFADSTDKLELISDNISETGRWSEYHDVVFKDKETDGIFSVGYSKGLTESQDEYPFDDEGEMISCDELIEGRIVVKTYLPIERGNPNPVGEALKKLTELNEINDFHENERIEEIIELLGGI